MNYRWNTKSILTLIFIIYILLKILSEQTSGLFLAFVAIIFIPCLLIARFLLQNFLYKSSIHNVKRHFVSGKNTLCNNNCMIKYYPDEKIVVSDNINVKHDQYVFTVTARDVKNINKCWSDICRIFDEYTYLLMLKAYFESFYSETNINPVLVKRYVAPEDENVPTYNRQTSQVSTQRFENVVPSQNIININTANAQDISVLPGLNLIMAKKAVDYRNKHGDFSNEEDFFKAAGVKDYFKSKISAMIEIKKVKNPPQTPQNNENGRIVDF